MLTDLQTRLWFQHWELCGISTVGSLVRRLPCRYSHLYFIFVIKTINQLWHWAVHLCFLCSFAYNIVWPRQHTVLMMTISLLEICNVEINLQAILDQLSTNNWENHLQNVQNSCCKADNCACSFSLWHQMPCYDFSTIKDISNVMHHIQHWY